MMLRIENWRDALQAHIEANKAKEFEWGKHDCATWAASCVEVITGVNVIPDIVGSYTDVAEANRTMRKKLNTSNIQHVCENIFGEPKHIAYARAGDIVVAQSGFLDRDDTFGKALGICNGRLSYFVGETENQVGLIQVQTLDLDCAYHV